MPGGKRDTVLGKPRGIEPGGKMKYLLLVHHNEDSFAKLSQTTQQAMLDESIALARTLDADGQYLSESPLHTAATATLVRARALARWKFDP